MLTFIVVVVLGLGLLYIGYRMSLREEIRRGAKFGGCFTDGIFAQGFSFLR